MTGTLVWMPHQETYVFSLLFLLLLLLYSHSSSLSLKQTSWPVRGPCVAVALIANGTTVRRVLAMWAVWVDRSKCKLIAFGMAVCLHVNTRDFYLQVSIVERLLNFVKLSDYYMKIRPVVQMTRGGKNTKILYFSKSTWMNFYLCTVLTVGGLACVVQKGQFTFNRW